MPFKIVRGGYPAQAFGEGIEDIAPETLRKRLGLRRGELGLLAGGPPCQGFSKQKRGAHLGDERNELVLEFARLVREATPRFFLLENVDQQRIRRVRGRPVRQQIQAAAGEQDRVQLADLQTALQRQGPVLGRTQPVEIDFIQDQVSVRRILVAADDGAGFDRAVDGAAFFVADALAAADMELMARGLGRGGGRGISLDGDRHQPQPEEAGPAGPASPADGSSGIFVGTLRCLVDLDSSGTLNINDFVAFGGAFASGNLRAADFTGDGRLDINDFIAFQTSNVPPIQEPAAR